MRTSRRESTTDTTRAPSAPPAAVPITAKKPEVERGHQHRQPERDGAAHHVGGDRAAHAHLALEHRGQRAVEHPQQQRAAGQHDGQPHVGVVGQQQADRDRDDDRHERQQQPQRQRVADQALGARRVLADLAHDGGEQPHVGQHREQLHVHQRERVAAVVRRAQVAREHGDRRRADGQHHRLAGHLDRRVRRDAPPIGVGHGLRLPPGAAVDRVRAAVPGRGGALGADRPARAQPARRGADAPGRVAHRRRPAALPRLLVELRPRPAAAARRARRRCSGRRCSPGGCCGCCSTRAWPCWPSRWPGAVARTPRWRSLAWLAAALAMASPSLPNPVPAATALGLGAVLLARRAPVAAGRAGRAGGGLPAGPGAGRRARRGAGGERARRRGGAALRRRLGRRGAGLGRPVGAGRRPRPLLGPDGGLRRGRAGPAAAAAAGGLGRRPGPRPHPRLLPALRAAGRPGCCGRWPPSARRPSVPELGALVPLAAPGCCTCWPGPTSSTASRWPAVLPALLAAAVWRERDDSRALAAVVAVPLVAAGAQRPRPPADRAVHRRRRWSASSCRRPTACARPARDARALAALQPRGAPAVAARARRCSWPTRATTWSAWATRCSTCCSGGPTPPATT